MNIGEPYSFDGTNSIDEGTLTFSYKGGKLYLCFDSELHGKFEEELQIQEELDYTNLDVNLYCKDYYSPTEMYGISLLPDSMSGGVYVSLDYETGVHDEGVVFLGEETTLVNGAMITLLPQSDGSMYIMLYSAISANGNFEETLIEGNLFDVIGLNPSMLGRVDFGTAFSYLCEVENNCRNMDAAIVTGNPSMYCDGTVYRFSGEVVFCDSSKFFLKITDAIANNLIVCYTDGDVWVSKGDKVCVYGKGVGTDSYRLTYWDGSYQDFTTLAVDVEYALYQQEGYFNFTEILELYPEVQNFMYGNYELKDSSVPSLLERTLTIDDLRINDRTYTIENVYIDFAVETLTTRLSDQVYLKFNVCTTSKKAAYGDYTEYHMTFQFALDGSSCNYGCSWPDSSSGVGVDMGTYVKTSNINNF